VTTADAAVALEPEPTGSRPSIEESEAVHEPAKVLRIGVMVSQLLAEVRDASLDEAGRRRLRQIHDESIRELESTLSPDLAREVSRMALPLEPATPSSAELRVAQAQLVGWLQGLVHGIQVAIFAHQAGAEAPLAMPRESGDGASARSRREQAPFPSRGTYL
jgi:hypothetical protein